jgi:GNAT superfamily N-acetyltransferase
VSFATGSVRVESLARHHSRLNFNCAEESLDRYIREQATQNVRRGLARVFVAVLSSEPDRILGFFTLSATSIAGSALPLALARRLPRYPIPAALIGRVAVDRTNAGHGLGRALLADAITKIAKASETLAVMVVVVDPIDDAAQAFYATFGFERIEEPARRMFLILDAGSIAP